MKKITFLFISVIFALFMFSGCDAEVKAADGVYRVEMAEFDQNDYKDYVEFVVEGGRVVSLQANAYHLDDRLKTEDNDMRKAMEPIAGTYPEKFYRDLVNQYIGSGGGNTDVIAGATFSSDNFFRLMQAAKDTSYDDPSVVVVYFP